MPRHATAVGGQGYHARVKNHLDVIVIGAGAAGLYCAGWLGQRGLRVLVLDHARRIGEKIRISGGGRCNFTNLHGGDPARYLSGDPRFVRHALKAHPPARFIDQLRQARIGFHEKHRGQLFCDESSQQIVDWLVARCRRTGVEIRHPVQVLAVRALEGQGFEVGTSAGSFRGAQLVVATGGLSIPAIGASDQAWRLATQWGMATVPPRAGLVPFTLTSAAWQPFAALSGVALPVAVSVASGRTRHAAAPAVDRVPGHERGQGEAKSGSARPVVFEEDLLFTHRGLSGPAALQISSYWQPGQGLVVDLVPALPGLDQWLVDLKAGRPVVLPEGVSGQPHRQQLGTVLSALLPGRLARVWLAAAPAMLPAAFASLKGLDEGMRLAEIADSRLRLLGQALKKWPVHPAGTEGYRKAEVTVGGVATTELDSRTMAAHRVPGSYWIGEAVDVTGWLGGYNFQWAWASAWLAAEAIAARQA